MRLLTKRAHDFTNLRTAAVFAGLAGTLQLSLAGPAFAQRAVRRLTQINTPTVFYFFSRVVYCQGVSNFRLSRLAVVAVPERPAHGTVTTRDGVAPVQHCQGRLGGATIVTYVPERGYSGLDNFKLTVIYSLMGHTESQWITVHVQVGGAGNPK